MGALLNAISLPLAEVPAQKVAFISSSPVGRYRKPSLIGLPEALAKRFREWMYSDSS